MVKSKLDTSEIEKRELDRRSFLKIGAMVFITSLCPLPALALQNKSLSPNRHLSLFNTHTDEHLDVDYCINGQYCPEALSAINHILRDHRTEDIFRIDPKLLDLLFRISTKVNLSGPFHVISGYRSPTTNAMLRKKNKSVAKNSFHVKGQAIDIRLPGLYLSRLKKLAVKMNAGGVGYYPRSNFIHLDIGPVRYW